MSEPHSSQKAKLISLDSLTDQQRIEFDKYARWFSPGGVCVNVLVGREGWDVRPLVLEQGKVRLYRFSPPLNQSLRNNTAADLEGFAVIQHWHLQIRLLANTDQFLVVRPFVQTTMFDAIRGGDLESLQARNDMAVGIVEQVGSLIRRNLVHGHISPRNISFSEGRILFLDPRFACLGSERDEFSAPELVVGEEPPPSCDLFGLGKALKMLLSDSLTEHQQDVVDRLLLPSPRQRPTFSAVEEAFGRHGHAVSARGTAHSEREDGSKDLRGNGPLGSGRLLTPPRNEGFPRGENRPQPREFEQIRGDPSEHRTAQSTAQRPKSNGERKPLFPLHHPALATALTPKNVKIAVGAAAAIGLGLFLLKSRFPSVYYDLAHTITFLAPSRDAEYEADWASGEKTRVVSVARAATLDHEPAAENTIATFVSGGGKMPSMNVALMRQAFDPLWLSELSQRDRHAVFDLSLASLVPEAAANVPPLGELHPAVILAIAGQSKAGKKIAALDGIPLEPLTRLPDPVGSLFKVLLSMEVRTVGHPVALGLASIVSGKSSAAMIEQYIGAPIKTPTQGEEDGGIDLPDPDAEIETTLVRLAIALPIIQVNDDIANQFLGVLRDRGGKLGEALGWFDIEPIAKWSGSSDSSVTPRIGEKAGPDSNGAVPSGDKLGLLLGKFPPAGFTLAQYSDLLTFPLPAVRKEAARVLEERVFNKALGNMLALLSGDQNRLTREQVVGLLSALYLNSDRRKSAESRGFISQWFVDADPNPDVEAIPDPNTVLLILLSRSNLDASDTFNLEAARFLSRRPEWNADVEMLRVLARHPEPLARSLAYVKLDPMDPKQLAILKERAMSEKDESLKRSIQMRLELRKPGSIPRTLPAGGGAVPGVPANSGIPPATRPPAQNPEVARPLPVNPGIQKPSNAPVGTIPAGMVPFLDDNEGQHGGVAPNGGE